MSDETDITINERHTGVDWGEEWDIDQVEIEPTVWSRISSSHGEIFVATERVNGRVARAQVVGMQHVSDIDYVGEPFEFGVSREDSIQDIAQMHLEEPEQSVRNYLDEREE